MLAALPSGGTCGFLGFRYVFTHPLASLPSGLQHHFLELPYRAGTRSKTRSQMCPARPARRPALAQAELGLGIRGKGIHGLRIMKVSHDCRPHCLDRPGAALLPERALKRVQRGRRERGSQAPDGHLDAPAQRVVAAVHAAAARVHRRDAPVHLHTMHHRLSSHLTRKYSANN